MTSLRRILISGASGMIGTALVRSAEAQRISVVKLVRRRPVDPSEIQWDPGTASVPGGLAALEDIDAAIHLSGANVAAHRWTPAYKREIVASRIGTTRALVHLLKSLKTPPAALLCASATGIYGDRGDEILTEDSPSGQGFLAETCLAWEAEAAKARVAGIRVVNLRFGAVLSADEGALKKMLPFFRMGIGGKLGSGRQWMNWIALTDLVRAVLCLAESPEVSGPFNVVAPNPVTNAEFTRALGHALHRPAVLPAPAFALRAAFGEMADEGLLVSSRAVPDRLLRAGFNFVLPTIDSALKAITSDEGKISKIP
ncbi:MAG: TIGR01777 family oxidoreductase [Silvibacterium sp.]|nr:TIGR01777 family oxidoreductase [Silvibacterium sp.]MBV8437803.1 TIGR01777 family oxidoreductase [Silvibacterium sp.]